MKFIDAFKLNNAPKETKEGMFRDYTVYLPEAYTEEYMIRSDKTGRLCRYVMQHDDGTMESVYGYYGIRKSSKYPHKAFYRLLEAMTREQRFELYTSLCPVRFEEYDGGIEWLEKNYRADYYSAALEATEYYCIYNNSKYLNEFIYRTWKGFEAVEAQEA